MSHRKVGPYDHLKFAGRHQHFKSDTFVATLVLGGSLEGFFGKFTHLFMSTPWILCQWFQCVGKGGHFKNQESYYNLSFSVCLSVPHLLRRLWTQFVQVRVRLGTPLVVR